jgi:hypothetical protein
MSKGILEQLIGMTWKIAAALALCTWIIFVRCSDLERDNPVDPAVGTAASSASISLTIGLSKILLSVIHRVEAILVSAQMDSVVKELDISPLGPATGTIGTIPPGSGYALSLVGYDLDGNELFRGVQENITIIAGDTTAVSIDLEFTGTAGESGASGGAEDGSQQPAAEGSDESEGQNGSDAAGGSEESGAAGDGSDGQDTEGGTEEGSAGEGESEASSDSESGAASQ